MIPSYMVQCNNVQTSYFIMPSGYEISAYADLVFISRPSTLLSCNRVSLFYFKTLKPKKRVGLVV
jgi:hypothetical protein